jgi:probable O-glycosylation ligase (exosortase A-associated)
MKGQIFVYVLTYGGAFVALSRPFYGFLIYVAFAILKPPSLWDVPADGNFSRIMGIALILGWAFHGCGSWQFGRARPVVMALLGYLFWCFPAALAAPDQHRAWLFVESMAKIVIPCLVAITMIDSMAQVKQLAWVILLSHGYVAYDLNRNYLQGFNFVQEFGFGGMDNNCVAIAMVAAVGLGFFLGLHSERLWQKLLAFACTALSAHVIMLAFSRGGMLALTITGILSFLLIPKKLSHYLWFALGVIIALRLAGPEVRERYATIFVGEEERDYSSQSRIGLWKACWDVMLQRPVLGVGPDHFGQVAALYGFPPGKKAHSLWLEVGAELGFPGMLALMAYYTWCVVQLWPLTREWRPVPDPWMRHTARMIIASLVGFAVAAQFVTLEGLEAPYYIAILGAGVLKLASQPARPAEVPAPPEHAWPAGRDPDHRLARSQVDQHQHP